MKYGDVYIGMVAVLSRGYPNGLVNVSQQSIGEVLSAGPANLVGDDGWDRRSLQLGKGSKLKCIDKKGSGRTFWSVLTAKRSTYGITVSKGDIIGFENHGPLKPFDQAPIDGVSNRASRIAGWEVQIFSLNKRLLEVESCIAVLAGEQQSKLKKLEELKIRISAATKFKTDEDELAWVISQAVRASGDEQVIKQLLIDYPLLCKRVL